MGKRKADEITLGDDDEYVPVEHIEDCLDEAQEILDLTIRVSDREVKPDTRCEFRDELVTAAGSITTAHSKVREVLHKAGRKIKRRRRKGA